MNTVAAQTRRLRVAVLNRVFARTGGGAESYSIALVEQLAQRHEVHVYAQVISHDWPGVTYHHVTCPLKRPRWLNQIWYAMATWRATRQGFDVVHSHENTWHGRVQTIHVEPIRLSLLNGLRGGQRLLRWLKILTSPRLLTYVVLEAARMRGPLGHQVVVTSQALAQDTVAAYPSAVRLLSVVTPGVDMPQDDLDRAAARVQLGLPAAGRLILLVANDYGRKGLGTLLEALPSLPADVGVVVVGNAAQVPVFDKQARALGVRERVHFLGPLNAMSAAYRAADMLVHPTRADTFAMVVLEAMAHGLPVVVSGPAWCGIAGLLDHGLNALLLDDPTDAPALAASLLQVLDDAPLRGQLSAKALLFARQHSWPAAAAACEQVYFKSLTPPA